MRFRIEAVVLAALLCGACGGDSPSGAADTRAATRSGPSRKEIDAAIAKGVAYLVKKQNKDGSWGSPAPNLTVDIYAPIPGAHEAYAVGTSALDVSALIDCGAGGPGVEDAIRKGADYLVAHSRVKRASDDVIYNVWAQAYQLEAYARLIDREKDAARIARLKAAGADAVDMLGKCEYLEGGWGYYDFRTHTAHPGHMATSFTTATVLVALKTARDHGIEVPQRLVDRAIRMLEVLRKPDGAFEYSFDHRYFPQGGINKIKGSLARTPACYEALRDWGRKVTDAQVTTAFDNLEKEGRFLQVARKKPVPHSTWYQNSGYFCFYGYEYASRLLPVLAPERRARAADSIATYLVPLQEPDGSWWDYQLYDYHKPYGTGYVLTTLNRCR